MNETCAKNKLPFFQHAFQSVGQPRETERDRHALGGAGVSSCFKALLVGELAAAAIGAGRQQGMVCCRARQRCVGGGMDAHRTWFRRFEFELRRCACLRRRVGPCATNDLATGLRSIHPSRASYHVPTKKCLERLE
jgi:hypothetical protein